MAGEARYRLGPLTLPGPDDAAGAGCEAVALFADRARRADAHFALDGRTGPVVARLVTRLDGMPLAIELAAARVEALGVAQLLDRLDDRFGLLMAGDRLAAGRQRSLAATVAWSYQLLDEHERRVFRQVSVFPGPFTLEAAEAVAGAGAGPAVLRLVDCSLLVPPRAGPDGRSRYVMLETLRAYGTGLLAEAGEQEAAAAALAGYALQVAEEAAAGLQTGTGELLRPAAGCRGRHDAAGAGVGHGPRCGHRAAAGGRACAVVAAAAGWRVSTRCCARGRARRGGQRGWRAAQFWLGGRRCTRRSDRGAGPLHRGLRRRRGPAASGAGRLPAGRSGRRLVGLRGGRRRPPLPGRELATRPGSVPGPRSRLTATTWAAPCGWPGRPSRSRPTSPAG